MASAELQAEPRQETGRRRVLKLRRAGKVPAVLCERGKPSMNLTVAGPPLRKLMAGGAQLIDLVVGGRTEKVLLKEVQWDVLGEQVVHVDFQKVSLTERVQVDVEVVLKGKPVGVSEEGGQLMAQARSLKVSCLPTQIPASLEVDVSAMKMNDVLHASAVVLPAGVALATDPQAVVCAVVHPKAEEVPAAEAAAAPTTVEPELIRKERKEEAPEEEEGKAE
jgi:large subunit ribosomal protein L25